jgi:hypothetical protein
MAESKKKGNDANSKSQGKGKVSPSHKGTGRHTTGKKNGPMSGGGSSK